MRTALRASIFPFFAAPVVLTVGAGLFIACGSSPTNRGTFDDGVDSGEAGSVPNFGNDGGDAAPVSCATAEANTVKPPVDFIFAIDQSGSMAEETAGLQANLNSLSTLLQKSALDYRVVLIAGMTGTSEGAQGNPVCVPPPLAGPSCSSNGTTFRAVNQHVDTPDMLEKIITTFKATGGDKAWADFLRPEALKIFVMVSDENATTLRAQPFDAQLLSLGGKLFGDDQKRNYVVYPIIGAGPFPKETLCTGGNASQTGAEFITLAKLTGGKWFPVCNADFKLVFDEIGLTVNAAVACQLAIPTVEGQDLDPERVNVKVKKADGTVVEVLQDSKDCNNGADGWQYSADGKSILLCGAACENVKKAPDDKVTVEFGCQTKVK